MRYFQTHNNKIIIHSIHRFIQISKWEYKKSAMNEAENYIENSHGFMWHIEKDDEYTYRNSLSPKASSRRENTIKNVICLHNWCSTNCLLPYFHFMRLFILHSFYFIFFFSNSKTSQIFNIFTFVFYIRYSDTIHAGISYADPTELFLSFPSLFPVCVFLENYIFYLLQYYS